MEQRHQLVRTARHVADFVSHTFYLLILSTSTLLQQKYWGESHFWKIVQRDKFALLYREAGWGCFRFMLLIDLMSLKEIVNIDFCMYSFTSKKKFYLCHINKVFTLSKYTCLHMYKFHTCFLSIITEPFLFIQVSTPWC